jgi:hypothetical protein
MNKIHFCVRQFAIITIVTAATQLHAQHYPAGSEGIKAGSLPSPGFTFEDENSFYYADKIPGFEGAFENGLNTFYYVQTPRLTWMSDWKILGANFGMAIRVPIEYKGTTIKRTSNIPGGNYTYTSRQFGLADIEIQPVLLSWNLKHFDISTGYSFWAPTGDYDKKGFIFDNLGQGYWTHSFMLGVTWYPDTDKTWAISLLNHYDINTAQYSSLVNVNVSPSHPLGIASEDTTLGNIDTLEWAVSKTITKSVDIGLTGYYQQQVTDTEGPTFNGPTWKNEKIHVAGIGPEIRAYSKKWGLSGSLRYAYEFSAMDHPQGNLVTLTIIKSF